LVEEGLVGVLVGGLRERSHCVMCCVVQQAKVGV
jgi:hypothetical protein